MMTEALRRAGEMRSIEFERDRFYLRLGDAGDHTMFLGNAYTDYCAAPWSQRKQVLRNYATVANLTKKENISFDEAKPHLLPRVRERFYFASFDLNVQIERAIRPTGSSGKLPMDNFVITSMNDDLTLEVVQDLPDAIKSVGKTEFKQWNVTFDEAISIAKENLWRASNQNFVVIRPGLFASPWQDTHDASRLFLHDLIWQLPVKGDHVAAVPNRNVLLVTGSQDTENLKAMASLVDASMQQPRPMTGQVFRLDGKQWVNFLPSPTSDAH